MRQLNLVTLFLVAVAMSTPASAGVIYNLIEPPGIPGDSAGLYGFSGTFETNGTTGLLTGTEFRDALLDYSIQLTTNSAVDGVSDEILLPTNSYIVADGAPFFDVTAEEIRLFVHPFTGLFRIHTNAEITPFRSHNTLMFLTLLSPEAISISVQDLSEPFSGIAAVVPTNSLTIARRANVSPVPEPGSLALFGSAAICLIGIAAYRRGISMHVLSR